MNILTNFIIFLLFCGSTTSQNNTTTFLPPISINNTVASNSLPYKNLHISLLFAMPPIAIVLYFFLLYLIISNKKKYSNAFYKLILAVSINDLYWLFYFLYQGLCLSTGSCPGGDFVNTIITTAAIYGFYVCMLLNLVLAWNRFAAIYFLHTYETEIFSMKMAALYLMIVYVVSGICNTPAFLYHMKYFPELGHHNFVNMPSPTFIRLWKITDLVLSYILHILIVVLYVSAFIGYRRKNAELPQKNRKDRRFLYQAMFSALPCLLFINCYHFNIATLELVLAEICAMVNPFVYLWFNSEIRKDFLSICGMKSRSVGSAAALATGTSPYIVREDAPVN